jgi:hypothetical protein
MKTSCTLIVGKRRFEGLDLPSAVKEIRSILRWRIFDRHIMALGTEAFPRRKRKVRRD